MLTHCNVNDKIDGTVDGEEELVEVVDEYPDRSIIWFLNKDGEHHQIRDDG